MSKGKKKKSKARRADRYELYQEAVQAPDSEVEFATRVFKKEYGRKPQVLREDFCGTAAVCCEWVQSHRARLAYGIDLDPEPMEWGREHNIGKLLPHERTRIRLIQGDVRSACSPKADVVAALNFSYFIFHERDEMLAYFTFVKSQLNSEGVFVLDLMGGPKCQKEELLEYRKQQGFTYVWEHHDFDPITHRTTCYIHFNFKDGSKRKRAFKYPWRLWTVPELRDILKDAGYRKSRVYWEGTDAETGEGNGVFTPRKHAPSDESWIAYIVAYP